MTFEPENSNFDQALANLNQVTRSLQKKGKGALDTLKEEVEKKVALGTLIPVSDEEWNEIKQHPHHFSLMTMVYSQTSVSTEKRLINHSKTKVKNKCTGMSLEQCNIENTLSSLNHILSGFELYPYPLMMDISKAYFFTPHATSHALT